MSRICDVLTKKQGAVPVLLNFDNGSVLPDQLNQINCNLLRDNRNGNDYIVSSSDNIIYKGQVESFQNTISLIAVRNKHTNKVTLIEIDKCVLSPMIHEVLDTSLENKSKKEMLSMLNKTFGSKKARRQTELRERMAVNVEEIKDQLEKTIQKTTINSEDLKVVTEADALDTFLLPVHRDATSVDKIFILNELIEPGILEALYGAADQMLNTEAEQIQVNNFIKEKILDLQNSNSSMRTQTCAVLLYIDSLMNYLSANYREVSKKQFSPCPYSVTVNKQLLDSFTMASATGRTRPMSMRDKTLSYIIALSILVCGYKVLVDNLAKSLKMNAKKLIDLARAIGVSQGKLNGENALVLKLPLPAPSSGYKGKRKGNRK